MGQQDKWLGFEREVAQGHYISAKRINKALKEANQTREEAPLKIHFEWEGRIYEGTAYYVGEAK